LAVLPLAAIAAGIGWLAGLAAWPAPLPGLLVVAVLTLGTRALHLDGLADTVDGLGSGRERGRALEIMRRGDVGPMGVVAIVLTLGVQSVAAGALTGSLSGAVLLMIVIALSRTSLLIGCRVGVPAARPGGLGSAVAGSISLQVLIGASGAAAVLLVGAVLLSGRPWWAGVIAVAAAALVGSAIVRRAVRGLGGITGDVLGALVELTLAVLLLGVTLVSA
ncbi:MAG: adenosylcobinamide-GDP ribazoletransferase, partial [Microlunatus sp.]